MPPIRIADWWGRNDFGLFLNGRGLVGHGVEVGTHRGDFASALLERWRGHLHCVDPWLPGYDDTDEASRGDRKEDMVAADFNLRPYRGRYKVHRRTSEGAVKEFLDASLDFVYVDGCHQPASVRQDLELWWPKLSPGGVLAGHDIFCLDMPGGGWGNTVQPVVFEFAEVRGLTVWVVPERVSKYWSYFMARGET